MVRPLCAVPVTTLVSAKRVRVPIRGRLLLHGLRLTTFATSTDRKFGVHQNVRQHSTLAHKRPELVVCRSATVNLTRPCLGLTSNGVESTHGEVRNNTGFNGHEAD